MISQAQKHEQDAQRNPKRHHGHLGLGVAVMTGIGVWVLYLMS